MNSFFSPSKKYIVFFYFLWPTVVCGMIENNPLSPALDVASSSVTPISNWEPCLKKIYFRPTSAEILGKWMAIITYDKTEEEGLSLHKAKKYLALYDIKRVKEKKRWQLSEKRAPIFALSESFLAFIHDLELLLYSLKREEIVWKMPISPYIGRTSFLTLKDGCIFMANRCVNWCHRMDVYKFDTVHFSYKYFSYWIKKQYRSSDFPSDLIGLIHKFYDNKHAVTEVEETDFNDMQLVSGSISHNGSWLAMGGLNMASCRAELFILSKEKDKFKSVPTDKSYSEVTSGRDISRLFFQDDFFITQFYIPQKNIQSVAWSFDDRFVLAVSEGLLYIVERKDFIEESSPHAQEAQPSSGASNYPQPVQQWANKLVVANIFDGGSIEKIIAADDAYLFACTYTHDKFHYMTTVLQYAPDEKKVYNLRKYLSKKVCFPESARTLYFEKGGLKEGRFTLNYATFEGVKQVFLILDEARLQTLIPKGKNVCL